jgi:hypothetical protein
MNKLLITGYTNPTHEGVTLHFNEPVALHGHAKSTEWWVSWDKIGQALFPQEYCDASDVATRRELRGEVKP